uniref:Uncharacterized protein n=1 Tax=Ditylenchus dipsaci TaxID=166011 RepID=A0A915CRV9_9BILA
MPVEISLHNYVFLSVDYLERKSSQEHLNIPFARPTRASWAKNLVSHYWKMILGMLAIILITFSFVQTIYHFKILKDLEVNTNMKLQELEFVLAQHKENLEDKGESRGKLLFTFNVIPLMNDHTILESNRKEIGGVRWFLKRKLCHCAFDILHSLIGTKGTLSFEGKEVFGSEIKLTANPAHIFSWSYFSNPANGFIDAAFNATVEARLSIRKTVVASEAVVTTGTDVDPFAHYKLVSNY